MILIEVLIIVDSPKVCGIPFTMMQKAEPI